jgi:acyl dehydratase
MPSTVFESKEEFLKKIGDDLGTSDWFEVTQEKVNLFADATGDHQWIHVDPERAAQGPFGKTIAHGYFTLSLVPLLMKDVISVNGVKMGINYGVNKVRFPSPVPVGKRVRLNARLASAEEVEPNGVHVIYEMTFEVEGEEKPACVAETIFRFYF